MATVKNHWSRDPVRRAEVLAKVSSGLKRAWKSSKALQTRANGAQQPMAKKKISQSVQKHWEDGTYDSRLNGMLGVAGPLHPNYKGGIWQVREIALQVHGHKCFVPLCTYNQEKIDVHHVDENHENFLLTNLVPLCVGHHLWENHYERKKAPFVTLRKNFEFEASHVLPWHPGKCRRLHGHSYKLQVWVERRMQEQGIALDFGDISGVVKALISEKLDHYHLNDLLPNPTAEHLLLWIWQELSVPLKGIRKMCLWETSNSCAEITAEDLLRSYWWVKTPAGWQFLCRDKK